MAVQILKDCKLYVGGYDYSGDMNQLETRSERESKDITVFGCDTKISQAGLMQTTINHVGLWRSAAGAPDPVLTAMLDTSGEVITVCPTDGADGEPALSCTGMASRYAPKGQIGEIFAFEFAAEGTSRLVRGQVFGTGTKTATGTGTVYQLGTAATGLLTLSGNAVAAETVTVGATEYTWVDALTTVPAPIPNEVKVGTLPADSRNNLVAAINAGTGAGDVYGEGTTANASATAAASGANMALTARRKGTSGNTVDTTETMTAAAFGAATLTGGVDWLTTSHYLYAALHVISRSGTSPTIDVLIQSDDNAAFSSPTTRVTFTQQSAIGSEWGTRLVGPITDDYWRASWTIGGSNTPTFGIVVTAGVAT